MGNGMGSGAEMSAEREREVRRPTWGGSLPALPRLLTCLWLQDYVLGLSLQFDIL